MLTSSPMLGLLDNNPLLLRIRQLAIRHPTVQPGTVCLYILHAQNSCTTLVITP